MVLATSTKGRDPRTLIFAVPEQAQPIEIEDRDLRAVDLLARFRDNVSVAAVGLQGIGIEGQGVAVSIGGNPNAIGWRRHRSQVSEGCALETQLPRLSDR